MVATNMKLARKTQADDRMEVDGDEQRRSSDVDPSALKVFPSFKFLWHFLTLPSLEPSPSFKMCPRHYVWHASTCSGLSALECAIPWADLAVFLARAPHVPPTHLQSNKLKGDGSYDSVIPRIYPSH